MIDGPLPSPFPWMLRNGLFRDRDLRAAAEEFPDASWSGWQRFDDEHEKKLACSDPPGQGCREVLDILGGRWMREFLGEKFGIPNLIADGTGGGMHMIEPGGYLGIHTDFNMLGKPMYRRLNVLLFLNDPWPREWGGALELHGINHVEHIRPLLNNLVVFETSDHSFHGHPQPLTAPECRKSLAVYYFTEEPPEGFMGPHGTLWK